MWISEVIERAECMMVKFFACKLAAWEASHTEDSQILLRSDPRVKKEGAGVRWGRGRRERFGRRKMCKRKTMRRFKKSNKLYVLV